MQDDLHNVCIKVLHDANDSTIQRLYDIECCTQLSPWTYDGIASCFKEGSYVFALFYKNTIIGFSVLTTFFDEAELLTLNVLSEYQGRGYGRLLLTESIKGTKELGALRCFLEVRVSNTVAINLYKSLRFELMRIRKAYYSATKDHPCEDAYAMSLDYDKCPVLDKESFYFAKSEIRAVK